MTIPAANDPLSVLGLPDDAGEAKIRARYLELVKQFPPDRHPETFREIRAAFDAARDPLLIARRLTEPPDKHAPDWMEAIDEQQRRPPPMTPSFLLSLGNRDRND